MSEVLMLVLMICMSILTLTSLVAAGVSMYLAWRSVIAFLASEAQKEEYTRFLSVMLDRVEEDSSLFRVEMVRRIGADIPEMRELNTLLKGLELSMKSFRSTLKTFITEG